MYEQLLEYITSLPVIDSHEHLPAEKDRVAQDVDFFTLFSHYCVDDLTAAGMPADDVAKLAGKMDVEEKWKLFAPWYEQMAELIPYASTVQIKPYLRSTAEPRKMIATDPERIIRLLKLGGYKGYVVLEYADDEDRFTVIPQWLTYLRELVS